MPSKMLLYASRLGSSRAAYSEVYGEGEMIRTIRLVTVPRAFLMTALVMIVGGIACPEITRADGDPTAKMMEKIESLEDQIRQLREEVKRYRREKGATDVAPVSVSETKKEEAPIAPTIERPTSPASTPSAAKEVVAVTSLNNELDPGQFGMTYRSKDQLSFGAYGEVKYGRQETSDGWRNGFDASRVVLLGTYPISDNIAFNTEIEFEHGGIAKDEDDKLGGSVDIEQIYVDFKVNDYFNWRAPGVDIVPVGYVGLFHEPTQFYSVDRPELYNGLIPSTWFEGATSVYGKIVDNLTYQVQINTGLEDVGTLGDESDSSVAPGGYDAGISGTEALGLARASISDRKQLGNNLGYAGRLAYTPPLVPGLAGSTSFYFTNDTSPRGAYATLADGSTKPLGKSSLSMVDTELRYRAPGTGVELRAEYVQAFFGRPKNLRANNDGDSENNVGDSMWGYSLEAAYHASLRGEKSWEFVPFYRLTREQLQTGGVEGADENDPTGAGNRTFHTFGISIFPTPKLVLKFDYQLAQDDAPGSPKSSHLLGGVGFFF